MDYHILFHVVKMAWFCVIQIALGTIPKDFVDTR